MYLFPLNIIKYTEHNVINEQHRHQSHSRPMVWTSPEQGIAPYEHHVLKTFEGKGAPVRLKHLACHTKQTPKGCRGDRNDQLLGSYFCQGRKAALAGLPAGQRWCFFREWRLTQLFIHFRRCPYWRRQHMRLHESHQLTLLRRWNVTVVLLRDQWLEHLLGD